MSNINKESASKSGGETPADSVRRSAIKKLSLGAVGTGTLASLPASWVKPVVDTVLLPSHAQTTEIPIIPTLESTHQNVTTPPVSGGTGRFEITISSPDATEDDPIVITALTPSSGGITGFTPGDEVTIGNPLSVIWVSPNGFVDPLTGIVDSGMFADLEVDATGAIQDTYIFTLAEPGDAPA